MSLIIASIFIDDLSALCYSLLFINDDTDATWLWLIVVLTLSSRTKSMKGKEWKDSRNANKKFMLNSVVYALNKSKKLFSAFSIY